MGIKQTSLHIAEAASLLGMVARALELEQTGATVLVWPKTPLGPLWGEVRGQRSEVKGQSKKSRLAALHWGVPEGYVVQPYDAGQQALWDMLDGYFKGELSQPAWEWFDPLGSEKQLKVWRELCTIPWGTTISYGELAQRVGMHPRAVGRMVGTNPIPVLIPCHRVVGKSGAMTGFSAPGGVQTKQWLLQHEGVIGCSV